MSVILHITKREQWEHAKPAGVYYSPTLETEGFIHCSTPQQIIQTANLFFKNQKGLVIFCIQEEQVQSEIRYEAVESKHFPHIYGPLNLDAVIQVIDFEPQEDGKFELPDAVANI
ncbi:DUF952 domain-containing protein [Microcoleus sp. FACHB-672]|uniref:DUF952 domain-containing protein n=1 Tax=Microcoleus sp. FACHB-672 TaxID=2692825 RepID=UPI0016872BE5|nr:DUF952 domain-containing protein [Microcoleus sp. FACHB-672]MBD2040056.1 DUF952 domain-containing protein [Microcoleus sp. FACHB-672]